MDNAQIDRTPGPAGPAGPKPLVLIGSEAKAKQVRPAHYRAKRKKGRPKKRRWQAQEVGIPYGDFRTAAYLR